MIKLNNKNITYVALADSNNSIKAPKEIWYADSNNSVKLVYRRKDALIEGEDYEKYHWLIGDADAYINTLKYYRPYDDSVQMTFRDNLYPNRESKYNKYNAEEQIWGASSKGSNYTIRSYISGVGNDGTNKFSNNILDSNRTESDVKWDSYAVRSFINASPEHSLYMSSVDSNTDNYYFIYNGDTKGNLPTRYTLPELIEQYVLIFYSANVTNGYFNGSFFNFIHYRNNVEITHLIPCKLLKPVPKWLDANGIRRQVGECGMIDLVSGKFYGNVNSVGTFTVENYYERKEWLVAEIYETTGVNPMCDLPINSDTFEFRVIMQSENSINIGHIKNPSYWYFSDNLTNIRVWNTIDKTTVFTSNIGSNDMTFKSTSSEFAINNIQVTKYGFPAKYKTFFNNRPNGNAIVYNSPITVDNKERYIPCTLTMDLPASMDANGIARTKGTSGMWDLVSDKFYGNVANSGTFKAVNLAEGVDYEVHQWLVGDGAYFRIPVNIYQESLYIKFHPTSSDFNKIFWEGFYNISSDATIEVRGMIGGSNELGIRFGIRENGASTGGVIYKTGLDYLSDFTIETRYSEDNKVNYTFNGTSGTATPKIDSRANVDVSVAFRTTWCKFAMVTTDRVNLIPVKLLKSIPSKYDANGIARNAGECGMYDTVNDVFYGNVASSGTFSVEDDN